MNHQIILMSATIKQSLCQDTQSISIIEQNNMFKYYISKDYRKTYNEIKALGLLSDAPDIHYITYEDYFRQLVIINPNIEQHLSILSNETPTPFKTIKALLFVHAWLQSTCVIENVQQIFGFMNLILKNSAEMAYKFKLSRAKTDKRISKSAIMNSDWLTKTEQIQFSKEVFLLQDVVKPYVLYLQKLVSIFDYYNSLKKNLLRLLNVGEVWVLMNIFKCANTVTSHIPSICKFIRKSYKPIAQSLGEAFSVDFQHFYMKLYKFIYNECSKIQGKYNVLYNELGEFQAYKKGIEGIDVIINLVQDVKQLNRELQALYCEPVLRKNRNIYQPKMVDTNGPEFQFVYYLEKMRLSPPECQEATPKFYRSSSSKNTIQTEEQSKQKQILTVFKEISNDCQDTFRKKSTEVKQKKYHIISRYKKNKDLPSFGEHPESVQ